MVSLGIVIAVSDYGGDAENLPACGQDGNAIVEVLRASGRFSDILHIDTDTVSTSVKPRLADFAKSHNGKDIDEILFYFTGHGEFAGDEFYYLLSDYQQRRRKQTSLENTELDNIIRALNPNLFVKVVDACHSGMAYIKSPDDFKEYLKSANTKFGKLYFLFSSHTDQASYQNARISYFTGSILKAITTHTADTIRYKDIIDYVSDEFEAYDFQKPFFVTQADFTEILCAIPQTLREVLASYIHDDANSVTLPNSQEKKASITDLLRADARNFCSKEEAFLALLSFENALQRNPLSEDIQEFYDFAVICEQRNPPFSRLIGSWLDQNKDDKGYFAKPTYETQTYKRPVHRFSDLGSVGSLLSLGRNANEKLNWEDAQREIIAGFELTCEMPYHHIRYRLEPKLANLSPEECLIVPILSRTHVRFFWAFSHFEYVDWSKVKRVGKLDWSTAEAPLRNGAKANDLLDTIVMKFSSFVEEPLRARWGTVPLLPSPGPT